MENLKELLNEHFENLGDNVWAEWLNDNQTKEPQNARGMLKALKLFDECKSLLSDDRVNLVVDDRALIVNLKTL